MTNMSFSGTAPAPSSGGIESFVYPSTGAPASTANLPQNTGQPAIPAKVPETPKISEADLKRLLSEAHAEGIREGEQRLRSTFEEEFAQQKKQLAAAIAGFEQERTTYYSKVEVELVHIALAIAARILHRETQTDPMVVAGLVKVMLEKLQRGTKVRACVPVNEAGKWRHYFQDNENLEVVEDPTLHAWDCKLETELGIADLGLDAQLNEIEQGFFDLIAQKPQPK
jgi:flagellar assembly protein FliH